MTFCLIVAGREPQMLRIRHDLLINLKSQAMPRSPCQPGTALGKTVPGAGRDRASAMRRVEPHRLVYTAPLAPLLVLHQCSRPDASQREGVS